MASATKKSPREKRKRPKENAMKDDDEQRPSGASNTKIKSGNDGRKRERSKEGTKEEVKEGNSGVGDGSSKKKKKKKMRAKEDKKKGGAATAVVAKEEKEDEDADAAAESSPPANDATATAAAESSTTSPASDATVTTIAPNSFAAVRPPLSPGILSAIQSYGFTSMTPVQSATLPLFLTHRDVFVRAVTGSGKTLAFLIPCVEMILRRVTLLKPRQIGALILEPTRELARQTHDAAVRLCRHCGTSEPLLLVGGKSGHRPVAGDLKRFAESKADIVVGTPGRVEDILTRFDDVDCGELEVLVLDESDVLLDMGFEVTITSILSRLPRMRRTGLFSATNASGVKRLAVRAGMRNPVVVDVAVAANVVPSAANDISQSRDVNDDGDGDASENVEATTLTSRKRRTTQATPSSLSNHYLVCPLTEKLSRLSSFLRQHSQDKVIVFFLTCACVEFYGAALQSLKPLPCEDYGFQLLHGKLAQKRREKAMEQFRGELADDHVHNNNNNEGVAKKTNPNAGCALLCTDVAARGLDVPDVSWTVQFDAPQDPASYVHRVGRSARAGRTGKSLLFLTRKEEAYVDFLRLRGVPLEELEGDEVCKPPSQEEEEEEREKERDDDASMEEAEPESTEMETEKDENEGKNDTKEERDAKNKEKGVKERKSNMTAITIRSAVKGPSTSIIPDVLPRIRKLCIQDREILEKGTKAFTSYIRAYKEHHCGFIFRFSSLDLGVLAASFCLLRLPKMPELRDKKLNFIPAGPEIDIHGISFKDKAREKQRQTRLAAELAAGGKNAKQIKAEQRAAERVRKGKEKRAGEIAKGRNPNKKRGKQQQIFDEWDNLAKEERMYKKLKQKKISKEEYDRIMYGEKEGAPESEGEGDDDNDDEGSGGDSD